MVREEDVKQLKEVLRFFVHLTSEAGREDDPKHREEVGFVDFVNYRSGPTARALFESISKMFIVQLDLVLKRFDFQFELVFYNPQMTASVKMIIQQWIMICQKPGENHEQQVIQFFSHLQHRSEETITLLFRIYAEYIAEVNFTNYLQNKVSICLH